MSDPHGGSLVAEYQKLRERLEKAEKVCEEAVGVIYNVATTVGTKTNSEMPKWFLLRIQDLAKAYEAWRKAKGEQ